MYCPKCSYNNPLNSRYCKNCELDLNPLSVDTTISESTEVLIYAGFWARLLAAFLDLLIIACGIIVLLFAIGGLIIVSGRDNFVHNNHVISIFIAVIAGFTLAYYIFTVSGEQCATIGKRWMGIKVLDIHGHRLSAKLAMLRLSARSISYLSLLVGFLMQPFTPRKQALHDLIARTIVVRANGNSNISFKATLLVLFFALMVPVLALFSTAGVPAFKQYIQRVQLERGIQLGERAAAAVAKFYLNNGKVPAQMGDADKYFATNSHISALDINQLNGELTLTFSDAERMALRNKHLIYTPTISPDHNISWKCHSNDIELPVLPANCR